MTRNIYKKTILNTIETNNYLKTNLKPNEKFSLCESWMSIDERMV